MFKRKKVVPDLTLAEINERLRGFVMDSQIQDGHELAVLLGCSVLSEELQLHEEQQSDERLERIAYLIPLMYAFAHTLAEGATEYQRVNVSDELKDLPETIWSESRKVMEQLSLSVLMGAVSQLIDMNLLEVPKHVRKNR